MMFSCHFELKFEAAAETCTCEGIREECIN